jgi:hypothetical protein
MAELSDLTKDQVDVLVKMIESFGATATATPEEIEEAKLAAEKLAQEGVSSKSRADLLAQIETLETAREAKGDEINGARAAEEVKKEAALALTLPPLQTALAAIEQQITDAKAALGVLG